MSRKTKIILKSLGISIFVCLPWAIGAGMIITWIGILI